MRCILAAALVASCLQTSVAHAATITVNTTTDELDDGGGDCSLREAIAAANTDAAVDGCAAGSGADTITLPAGTYLLTLAGDDEDQNATGDLDVNSDLTINGAGRGQTIIDGGWRLAGAAGFGDRVLHVGSGTVTLTDLTITGGRTAHGTSGGYGQSSDPGGGIYNKGTLTLQRCAVDRNATGNGGNSSSKNSDGGYGGAGGGIRNASGGSLTIVSSSVSENRTGDGGSATGPDSYGGGGGSGGGISNHAALTVEDTVIADNTCGDGGAGTEMGGMGGTAGAVVVSDHNSASFSRCTISGNRSGSSPDPSAWSDGGAIWSAGTLTIDRCTFSDNHALLGGGGAVMQGVNGSLTITHSTFSGNSAAREGGAVNTLKGGRIESSTIAGNTADSDDSGGESGGGIHRQGGTLRLRNTIIAGNRRGTSAPADSDCSGSFTSEGHNLSVVGGGCPDNGSTDVALASVAGVKLGPLADNGGPTLTRMLEPSSPAVDNGSCSNIAGDTVATDQRDLARGLQAGCDIGAVEGSFNQFVVVSDEPVGVNCTTGGKRISTGFDDDRDGVLDPVEVDTTDYVCNGKSGKNGEDGEDGAAGVDGKDGKDGEPGAAGPAGADGKDGQPGAAGPAGKDGKDGKDGVDGKDGAAGGTLALVDLADEAPGENCAEGGTRITTGLDRDGDGTLDEDEVEREHFVCNGAAGTSGPNSAAATGSEDGGGCAISRVAGGSPWVLVLLFLVARLRRSRVLSRCFD